MNENKTATAEKKEKCFVIMPISDQGDYPSGHFTKVYEQIIKPAVENAGYEAYRVDENKISDSIIDKIFDAVQNCPIAVCDLSNNNPNVLYELGLRQAYDMPVVLIKDEKTNRVFDISAINTVPYSSKRLYEEVIDAQKRISDAITATAAGKENSLLKIINIKKAQNNDTEITTKDMTEFLLNSILSKLNTISRNTQYEVNNQVSTSLTLNKRIEELEQIVVQLQNRGERHDGIWNRLIHETSILLSELHSGKYTPLFIDIYDSKLSELQNIILENMSE